MHHQLTTIGPQVHGRRFTQGSLSKKEVKAAFSYYGSSLVEQT